jgi:hypothetical protein
MQLIARSEPASTLAAHRQILWEQRYATIVADVSDDWTVLDQFHRGRISGL